ncbi:hypothetical protein HaLaN_03573 [Haematococcus lacustris]|uniref:Uncharacterized protein n=1 Tax=Haematococcus lacustris TaxID=44745 RepID=A0A699YKS7_HAELA|nr:hypothetical protein HaLaN_03573 [Haematococcus lacustris]
MSAPQALRGPLQVLWSKPRFTLWGDAGRLRDVQHFQHDGHPQRDDQQDGREEAAGPGRVEEPTGRVIPWGHLLTRIRYRSSPSWVS